MNTTPPTVAVTIETPASESNSDIIIMVIDVATHEIMTFLPIGASHGLLFCR